MIGKDQAAAIEAARLAAKMRRAELVRVDGDEGAVEVIDALLRSLDAIVDAARQALGEEYRAQMFHAETGRSTY